MIFIIELFLFNYLFLMKSDFILIWLNLFVFSSNNIIKLPFYKQISNNFLSNYFNIELNTNLMIGNPYQKIEMTLSLFTQSFILKGLLFNSEFNEKNLINLLNTINRDIYFMTKNHLILNIVVIIFYLKIIQTLT